MKIQKRFLEGLKNYNLTQDEIKDWVCCGGNYGSMKKYWNLVNKKINKQLPIHKDNCICGHSILKNAYITDNINTLDNILVLGSCCITRFQKTKLKRTCDTCGEVHKNRVVNRCNTCRESKCDDCGKEETYYKKCAKCFFKKN